MRFQVPPKAFRLDGWITQRIRQWVANCRTGDWESPQVPNVLRRNRAMQTADLFAVGLLPGETLRVGNRPACWTDPEFATASNMPPCRQSPDQWPPRRWAVCWRMTTPPTQHDTLPIKRIYRVVQQRAKAVTEIINKSYLSMPVRLDCFREIKLSSKIAIIVPAGIRFCMRDLVCDVNYSAWAAQLLYGSGKCQWFRRSLIVDEKLIELIRCTDTLVTAYLCGPPYIQSSVTSVTFIVTRVTTTLYVGHCTRTNAGDLLWFMVAREPAVF